VAGGGSSSGGITPQSSLASIFSEITQSVAQGSGSCLYISKSVVLQKYADHPLFWRSGGVLRQISLTFDAQETLRVARRFRIVRDDDHAPTDTSAPQLTQAQCKCERRVWHRHVWRGNTYLLRSSWCAGRVPPRTSSGLQATARCSPSLVRAFELKDGAAGLSPRQPPRERTTAGRSEAAERN
jgi:hypothetical protein